MGCAVGGVCKVSDGCEIETGSSCRLMDCDASRRAWCDRDDYQCKCLGGCGNSGECMAPTAPTPPPTPAPTAEPTAPPTAEPTAPPTEPPTRHVNSKLCRAHPACSHLHGYCCPNREGVNLYCCDDDIQESAESLANGSNLFLVGGAVVGSLAVMMVFRLRKIPQAGAREPLLQQA